MNVGISLLVVALATAMASLAFAAPARADDRSPIASINRQLAGLVKAMPPQAAVAAQPAGAAAQPAGAVAPPARQLSFSAPPKRAAFPFRIPVGVLRLTRMERALHLRSHGLDANFWGVFNGGRGISVKYSFAF